VRSTSRLDGRNDLQVEIAPWARGFPREFCYYDTTCGTAFLASFTEKGVLCYFHGIVLSKTVSM
jgi:hypothetical protein